MNKIKLLLMLLVLALAVVGAFFVFGLIAAAFQWLVWLGLIVLIVGVAVKLLKKSDRPTRQLDEPDIELERADRLLEEMRRRQLTK